MTDTEFLKGCEELAPVVGRPEWIDSMLVLSKPNYRLVPQHERCRIEVCEGGGWMHVRATTDHEAACIWKEWIRAWLAEREVIVTGNDYEFALLAAVAMIEKEKP